MVIHSTISTHWSVKGHFLLRFGSAHTNHFSLSVLCTFVHWVTQSTVNCTQSPERMDDVTCFKITELDNYYTLSKKKKKNASCLHAPSRTQSYTLLHTVGWSVIWAYLSETCAHIQLKMGDWETGSSLFCSHGSKHNQTGLQWNFYLTINVSVTRNLRCTNSI